MSQTSENMQRTGELQNSPEHVHLVAEQQRNKQEHLSGSEQSRRSLEHTESLHSNHPATTGHGVTAFGHEDIAALAHQLWLARGCPSGSPDQDWFQAVKQLRERAIAGESFHA